tara:strand:+ start:10385 stop:10852 length:468 start_codon:yes stop_codon:yes gene_type:complete
MIINFKHYNYLFFILFSIILFSCQLKEPSKNHGILFLKNRSDKLIISKTNKNDAIKIIGYPHSKSITNEDQWFYFERVLTKGEFLKLGKNVLKENNILILKFDKYGLLKEKRFLNKNNNEDIKFSEKITQNEITQKSFVEKFLNSIKNKMYGNQK